jgi:hypothetical protein
VASEILIFYNSPVLEKMVFVIGGSVVLASKWCAGQ